MNIFYKIIENIIIKYLNIILILLNFIQILHYVLDILYYVIEILYHVIDILHNSLQFSTILLGISPQREFLRLNIIRSSHFY